MMLHPISSGKVVWNEWANKTNFHLSWGLNFDLWGYDLKSLRWRAHSQTDVYSPKLHGTQPQRQKSSNPFCTEKNKNIT